MNEPKFIRCCKTKSASHAYLLTKENARELLDMMGFDERSIDRLRAYGDEWVATVDDEGIEYGSILPGGEIHKANYGDYIVDYDGRLLWQVYSPEEFRETFYKIAENGATK